MTQHRPAETDMSYSASLPNRRRCTLQRWSAAGLLAIGLWQPVLAQTSGNSTASRSVTEWLARMHEASRQRAYTGTLVVSSASTMSASRIWHVCDGTQQMERVETLTGAPRSTIRHNSDVITFAPEGKVAWVGKRDSLGVFPELLRTPSNNLPEFYSVSEGTSERVAGYLADVVDIQPRDGLRFGYRIWAEKRTGLVLKLQTLADQGVVLEQVAFTELQLDAPVRMDKLKRLMKDTKGYDVQRQVLRKTSAEAEGWRLKESVPGFLPMSCHTRDSESHSSHGLAPMQWVFSDGLASVSLFVEPFDAQRHASEKSAVTGATHSLTRRVGAYWVTALGEVPPVTLKRFASALERTR
jgi:sigma-E factor negative regulatory protein RseB